MNTSNQRQKENPELRELNDVGKRITWCRNQLNLTQKKVSEATGISLSNYANREYGVRSIYHEEYLAIARFFSENWTPRVFEGTPINKVKAIWLMFGILEE